MKTIKFQVEAEVWELFYRLFSGQGERTRLLRNFVFKKIREEQQRKRKEEEDGSKDR